MITFKGYKFRGKHASYVKNLSKDRGQVIEDRCTIFNRIIDAYMIAALVGLKFNKRSKIDTSVNDSSDISLQIMQGESDNLNDIYRIIMLLDTSTGLSEKERIDRAFKSDSNDEAVEKNLELMNSYVLGGIEILHDMFGDLKDKNEDEKSQKMLFMIQLINEMSDETDDDFLTEMLDD